MRRSIFQIPAGTISLNDVMAEVCPATNMGATVKRFWPEDSEESGFIIIPESGSTTGVEYIKHDEVATIVIPAYPGKTDIMFAFEMLRTIRRQHPDVKIMRGSKEADISQEAEGKIWKRSQKAVADAIADDVYEVIEGANGCYRLFSQFLKEKYPGRTTDELVGLAFGDFAALMKAIGELPSFGYADITDPDGEEYDAIMLTNRTAAASLTRKIVLCRKGEPKIVDSDDFRDYILHHPAFEVYDVMAFSMKEMSDADWETFCDSLPGETPIKPKTYLMRWNPAISSFRAEYYDDASAKYDCNWCMDWSIYEHEGAHKGDHYFMLREGDGVDPGIYFHGKFTSRPYEGDDWAGSDRKRYYVDITCLDGRPLSEGPWITTDELEAVIPEINWRRGHSGQLLTDEQAEKLFSLWRKKHAGTPGD